MVQMSLTNIVSGKCWKCTEREHGPDHQEKGESTTRIFELCRAMVTRTTPTGTTVVDVRDALKCRECGELVPLDTWRSYQASGDIVIRKMRKGDRVW